MGFISTVHELSSRELAEPGFNLGLQDEKRDCYLCVLRAPPIFLFDRILDWHLLCSEQVDVVRDELDPVGEDCEVVAVDDPGVGPVHAPDLEGVGPQLVGAEDVAGDVGHH